MEQPFQQVEISKWPSGDCRHIGALALEPPCLEAKLGIRFVDDHDDLDSLKRAGIQLPSGEQFLFIRHAHAPIIGTEVLTDTETPQTDALLRFLAATGLPDEIVSWAPNTVYRIVAIPGQVQVHCGKRIVYSKGMVKYDFVADRSAARDIGLAFIQNDERRIVISDEADGEATVVSTAPVPRRR